MFVVSFSKLMIKFVHAKI